MPHWDTTSPCRTHPDDFLQPGEDPLWHLSHEAQQALATCRTCPHTRQCARKALTAGTTQTDDGCTIEACADGAIYAGIVCRGDLTTRRQLNQLVNPASGASHCAACNRPFRTPNNDQGVYERRDGLCRGCWKAVQRTGMGVAATPRSMPPAACIDCSTPMVPWGHPRPDGHVNHDSGGRCKRCAKVRARRLTIAA